MAKVKYLNNWAGWYWLQACSLWQVEDLWCSDSSFLLSSLVSHMELCKMKVPGTGSLTFKQHFKYNHGHSRAKDAPSVEVHVPSSHWAMLVTSLFFLGLSLAAFLNGHRSPSLCVTFSGSGWWRVLFLQEGDLPSQFAGSRFSPWVLVKRRFSAFVLTLLPMTLASQLLTCVWQFHLCLLCRLLVLSFSLPESWCSQGPVISLYRCTLWRIRFYPTSMCNSDLFTSISTWVSRRNLGAACLRLNDLSCLSLFLVIILSWLEVLPSTVSPKVEIWEPFFIPTCISLPVSYQCSSPWKVTPLSRLHHRLTSSLVLLKVAILCHLTACCKVSGISPRLF